MHIAEDWAEIFYSWKAAYQGELLVNEFLGQLHEDDLTNGIAFLKNTVLNDKVSLRVRYSKNESRKQMSKEEKDYGKKIEIPNFLQPKNVLQAEEDSEVSFFMAMVNSKKKGGN